MKPKSNGEIIHSDILSIFVSIFHFDGDRFLYIQVAKVPKPLIFSIVLGKCQITSGHCMQLAGTNIFSNYDKCIDQYGQIQNQWIGKVSIAFRWILLPFTFGWIGKVPIHESALHPPPSKSRTSALNGLVCSSIEMHTSVPRKGRRETPSSHAPRGQFFPNPFNRSPTKEAPTLLPISVPLSSSDHQPPSSLSNPISLSETSPPRRSHHPPATGMNPLSILHFKPLYPQQLQCPRLGRNIILSFSSPSSFRMGRRGRGRTPILALYRLRPSSRNAVAQPYRRSGGRLLPEDLHTWQKEESPTLPLSPDFR